jgi:hypothetical protein
MDEEVLSEVAHKLKGPPLMHIILEVPRSKDSSRLAMKLVFECARRWAVVLFDCSSHVYSVEELSRLGDEGDGLFT